MEEKNTVGIGNAFKDKETFIAQYRVYMAATFGKTVEEANEVEKYTVLIKLINSNELVEYRKTTSDVRKKQKKALYYFSLEFLLGRMLSNNLMAMGAYGVVKEGLNDLGIDINKLEDLESDPGLGNGGLGRLAACFLDSLATLNYRGNGNTIRYKNGLFKQMIIANTQVEVPDQWLRLGNHWEIRRPEKAVEVNFYGNIEIYRDEYGRLRFNHKNCEKVLAVPYDMPIVGADGKTVNSLRMWSAEPSDILPKGQNYRKYLDDVDDICLNLYPDDSNIEGRYLRIKQEYFFVCAGLKSIINDHLRTYGTLDNFADKVVIQLNDTHPSLAVPELMRVLMDEYNYEWDKAKEITFKTFAYTNHTVLAEALEKWPQEYIQKLLPRIYLIIEEIDRQFKMELLNQGKDPNFINSVSIISDGQIRMAYLSIVGSFSVNGVAQIHSDILKNDVFRNFYEIYPYKFNNKTNGITQRRWLFNSNPELTNLIKEYIGPEFLTDFSKVEDLMNHVDDQNLQNRFMDVKKVRKQLLADFEKDNGIVLDPNSIFDVQAKRLHAYKRQLLSIMYVISLYIRLKEDPNFRMPKVTFIYSAKAYSSYTFAKKVIKLICCVGEKIDKDPYISQFIKVAFLPNYSVTLAEKLINAADISEQISLAGKEASGTGNMKFMMNGAITLGTLDGANVEIANAVGDENIVIFGMKADEVSKNRLVYRALDYYEHNDLIKKVIDLIASDEFATKPNDYEDIVNEFLTRNDEYMLLADFDSYCKAKDQIYHMYEDRSSWAKKCLINIAKSSYFSSDRTIDEYVKDIWHIEKIDE